MDTIPKPVVSLPPRPRKQSFAASYPRQAMPPPAPPLVSAPPKLLPPLPKTQQPTPPRQQQQSDLKPQDLAPAQASQDKPYVYKPRKPSVSRPPSGVFTPQKFTAKPAPPISPVSQQLVANQQRAASQQHSAGKGLSFGTDPRFKGSATFRSSAPSKAPDRFSSPFGGTNGFPQLPGLTWPPAHMTSGYSQPQTRVWPPNSTSTSGPGPERIPMTSSDLKPTSPTLPKVGAASPQQTVKAYQKYTFFQVHHNR